MATLVLLVEDHDDTRAMCALGLTLEGFTVREADSAAAALALLQDETPDIIVTDISMPGMDGIELCRQIRTSRDGKRIPLLVISGHSPSPTFGEVSAAGACAACSKPLTPDALSDVIHALLAERSTCWGCWETGGEFANVDFGGGVRGWMRHPPRARHQG